jgi:hypothetical protein
MLLSLRCSGLAAQALAAHQPGGLLAAAPVAPKIE